MIESRHPTHEYEGWLSSDDPAHSGHLEEENSSQSSAELGAIDQPPLVLRPSTEPSLSLQTRVLDRRLIAPQIAPIGVVENRAISSSKPPVPVIGSERSLPEVSVVSQETRNQSLVRLSELAARGDWKEIAEHPETLPGLTGADRAEAILTSPDDVMIVSSGEQGDGATGFVFKESYLLNNLDKFSGYAPGDELARALMYGRSKYGERRDGRNPNLLMQNLDKFSGISPKIAVSLLRTKQSLLEEAIIPNLKSFNIQDASDLAKVLIQNDITTPLEQPEKFSGLKLDDEFIKNVLTSLPSEKNAPSPRFQQQYMLKYIVDNIEKFDVVPDSAWIIKTLDLFEDKVSGIHILIDRVNQLAVRDQEEFARVLIKNGWREVIEDRFDSFTGDAFDRARIDGPTARLSPLEAFVALDRGDRPTNLNEKRYQEIFDRLVTEGIWNDELNVVRPFRDGAEKIGYQKMFHFLGRPGLSRHDGLHAFDKVLAAQEQSGVTPEEFYTNILQQVALDGSTYESGTAHHELNRIAQDTNFDATSVKEKAALYPDIPSLQKLVETFNSDGGSFAASWSTLKQYAELAVLVDKADLLEKLHNEPNETMRNYVERLAFHPGGRVNMREVFSFWEKPDEFLQLGDTHTPEKVHERKKPSNLTEIPHLDLTAAELRDALVNGAIDKIQAFSPLEVSYVIGLSLQERLKAALGSRQEKIPGIAQNPGKLFARIRDILSPHGISARSYLEGAPMPLEVQKALEAALMEPGVGVLPEAFPILELEARIGDKSDPEAILAGNDTASCMPFGSGKNNVYMFNPNVGQMVLRLKRDGQAPRTIAQSVLTKDRDIGKSIPEVDKLLTAGNEEATAILGPDILEAKQAIIACDNVEVAPNYRSGQFPDAITRAYQDFFQEYIQHYGTEQNLNSEEVVIGTGYSDTLGKLSLKKNTYAPLAPVGYSDNAGEHVYSLPLGSVKIPGAAEILEKRIERIEATVPTGKPPGSSRVEYLTYEDSLATAYLEGKAYGDNKALMENLSKLENTLIAKDIANTTKDRPNLSLANRSDAGHMRGYMIAYEGKYQGGQSEKTQLLGRGEAMIYIADFAVENPGQLDGARAAVELLDSFIELYKTNYLDKQNPLPIYAYARENTSYRLITRQLTELSKRLNVPLQLIEGEPYKMGGETMRTLLIRPLP